MAITALFSSINPDILSKKAIRIVRHDFSYINPLIFCSQIPFSPSCALKYVPRWLAPWFFPRTKVIMTCVYFPVLFFWPFLTTFNFPCHQGFPPNSMTCKRQYRVVLEGHWPVLINTLECNPSCSVYLYGLSGLK